MSRKSLTQQEVSTLQQWAIDNHVIVDDSTEVGQRQCEFLIDYFLKSWTVDVTPANLQKAAPILLPHLQKYNEEDVRLADLMRGMTSDEQRLLTEKANLPPGLKNTKGNLLILLSWIKGHGFQVTQQNLQLAAGQNNVVGHLEWEDSANKAQKGVDARRHLDDGSSPFTNKGLRKLPDGSYGRTPLDAKREANAAAEKNRAALGQQDTTSATQARAKADAEAIQGNRHSETEALRRIFVLGAGNQVDWVATLAARQRAQGSRSIR